MRVSDYIADLLAKKQVHQVFSVVGGGAMHLNDAFGHHPGLHCVFNHHEQASAMAAESYYRVNNQLAVACVTSGPGGTNAITGVLCAWNDSIPLLVISGQVRRNTTIASTGLPLRQFGEQEFNIIDAVRCMTKYAVMITDPEKIRYHIERAIYEATTGRRGPCWLDIPLDIQGMDIDIDQQEGFVPIPVSPEDCHDDLDKALEQLFAAERPVVIAGSAIRSAGVYPEFRHFLEKTHIPAVAATGICDLFPVEHPDYFGNFGVIGGRAGNFIIQNADHILVLGARLSFKQIGFNYEMFAPKASITMVDIDPAELKKNTIRIDHPLQMDLKDFFSSEALCHFRLRSDLRLWKSYCNELKSLFPIYQEKFRSSVCVNPYYLAEKMISQVNEDAVIVVGNSCASDMTRQIGIRKEGQRMWGNTNCGTMGYDLPAAVGAAVAANRMVICMTGDGSIMMNLQELETISFHHLPVKVFIHNNQGYEAIMTTHTNFFGRLTGCNQESGIGFPSFEKIAGAFGLTYCRMADHSDVDHKLSDFLHSDQPGLCEVISDATQGIEPKSKSKKTDNGQIVSPPIEDLFPFLERSVFSRYSKFENYAADMGGESND